jgi:hypothetical protein
MTYGEVVLMANIHGLNKVLEYIKANPTEWDQTRWHTCFAGTTLRVLMGAELTDPDCCNLCRGLVLDGDVIPSFAIAEMALDMLDLGPEWEHRLFNACNTLEDLERIVAEISVGEQVPTEAPV